MENHLLREDRQTDIRIERYQQFVLAEQVPLNFKSVIYFKNLESSVTRKAHTSAVPSLREQERISSLRE